MKKIKADRTTTAIRNAGFSAILKVKNINKRIGRQKVKCSLIPHYA